MTFSNSIISDSFADALLSETITNNTKVLDDLAILLDTEYQHGGVASWHDMALLLDIPKEAFDHCLSYSKSSPTESLMMFLSNTKPQFTIRDLKDSLRSIGRTDVVHILDRYIASKCINYHLFYCCCFAESNLSGNSVLCES